MARLTYRNQSFELRPGESVLDGLIRRGVNLPFSCRMGVCHTCMQRVVEGEVPRAAQSMLAEELQALGYFLPCKCVPAADIVVAEPRDADLYIQAVVHAKELLAPHVCRILLDVGRDFRYRPGQFINVRQRDGLIRSYSLAGLPGEYFLELHVKRMRNGGMSGWIFDTVQLGDVLEIQEPQGANFYSSASLDQPLLLVGTGTGLAPLLGIVREALAAGHSGPIHLYHGSRTREGLYLHARLTELASRHQQFSYTGCVSGEEGGCEFSHGRAHEIALARHRALRGWRVHLAGLPAMVHAAGRLAAAAGAHPAEVHADAFEYRDLRATRRPGTDERDTSLEAQRRRDPAPDPGLWAALRGGEGLMEILTDFYRRVYDDPRLSPYFEGITKKRSIEKQYQFLRQIFSGEQIYFGDRPRTAHHWMVISDELFDYREDIMMDCLRRYGLSEELVRRWLAIEETYRADIVKAAPRPRIVGGVEQPAEGFGRQTMAVATLCDSCRREIDTGESVLYHLRLGTTFCRECAGDKVLGND